MGKIKCSSPFFVSLQSAFTVKTSYGYGGKIVVPQQVKEADLLLFDKHYSSDGARGQLSTIDMISLH
jgi:hypothetical protein